MQAKDSRNRSLNQPLGPSLVHSPALRIAESPPQDRPRERLQKLGAAQLRLAELLAVLVRSGRPGESALQAGEKVAANFSERLERLPAASAQELQLLSSAIGSTAYCQIMAGVELGRRVADASSIRQSRPVIGGTRDAREFCQQHFARLATDGSREEFHIVCLDTKNRFIAAHQISVGTLDASLVHPREVFRPAIKDSAASILLVHNHPSGDPTPSHEDLTVTDRLEESGVTLGIEVLDHIVLGHQQSTSIREYR